MGHRLLVVAPSALPGRAGVRRATLDLASGLRERCWDVTLLTTGVPGLPAEFESHGLHVVTVPGTRPKTSSRRWAAGAERLVRQLGLESFDAMIGTGASGEALRARRSPLVFQVQQTLVERYLRPAPADPWHRGASMLRPAALRRLTRELADLRRADAVVVPSPRTREALLRWPYRAVASARRARMVRNGVHTRRFHPDRAAGQAWRRQYGVPTGAPLVFSACRLDDHEGMADALVAFHAFHRVYPKARFVIAGSGPSAPVARRQALQLRLSGSVGFLGNVGGAALVRWMQASDVVLALPREEGEPAPVNVLEALACGPDVVAASTALDLALPHARLHAVPAARPDAAARALAWAWWRRGTGHDAPFPEAWTLTRCVRGYEAVLQEAMAGRTGRAAGRRA